MCVRGQHNVTELKEGCVHVHVSTGEHPLFLTHPDTALQRLDHHINVYHLKLLISQRWLIFFNPQL